MPIENNLGYGKQSEATIDQANIGMRAMPFYQDYMKSIGQDPGHPTLSKQQSQTLLKLAQGQGFVVDEGNMEMDDHGNFNPKGHKLRNTLIIAGLAGATIATMGAAGAFAGAGGAAGAGSAAAGTAGAAGAASGVAGGTAASVAAAAGAGSSLWSKAAGLAGPIGKAIGGASSAAGNNRLTQEQLSLQANRDNINGQKAAEDALMGRSVKEAAERKSALVDVARASDTRNPNISEFNTRGPKTYSDEYMNTLTALEQAGMARLKADPQYSTNNMPGLRTYQPLDIADLQGATNTKPGLMERIGGMVGPALSVYGGVTGQRAAVVPPRARVTDDEDDF